MSTHDTTALPEPLTPADCDLRDFAFMPLDVRRLLDSEWWITAIEEQPAACGPAVNLWCASWHQQPAGSLPDNDLVLRRLAGVSADVWQTVRARVLAPFVKCSDGRLYHPVVASKANEAWEHKLAQRERGRLGNAARWGTRKRDDGGATPPDDAGGSHKDRGGIAPASQKDRGAMQAGSPPDRKGQGQGQGQGEREQQRSSFQEAPPARASPETAAAIAVIELFDERSRAHFSQQTRAFPAATDVVMAQRWLAAGASMAQLRAVFDARMAARKAKGKGPIGTLSYLDEAVVEALRKPPPITARDPAGRRVVDLNLIAG